MKITLTSIWNVLKTSKDIALEKIRKYCAYQDRCHSEVRTKLLSMKIYGDDLEDIIYQLIQEKFLDELRFTKSFVRGKFKLKSWGRIKITHALKTKHVSEYCIRKGLEEIDQCDYLQCLEKLVHLNKNRYGTLVDFGNKQKLIKYLMQKGFEFKLIKEAIEKELKVE